MTIHSAILSNSQSARAFNTIAAPTPAGSPMVTAILGRLIGPPIAKFTGFDEGISTAESAGLSDNYAAVGRASLDESPWNARGNLSGEHDAGCVQRSEHKVRCVSTGEDERGNRLFVERGVDLALRGGFLIDEGDSKSEACGVFAQIGELKAGNGMGCAGEQEDSSLALYRWMTRVGSLRRKRLRERASQSG